MATRRTATRRRPSRHTASRVPSIAPPMPQAIGNKLVDISIELIEKLYVHLPLKRSMYAVNPVQRLRLLQRRLNAGQATPLSERQFYNEMLGIFSLMRDLHTAFVLPEPF